MSGFRSRAPVRVAAAVMGFAHGGMAGMGGVSQTAGPNFWQAASTGSGQVTVSWKVKGGTWTIVLMNASGAAQVSAAVSVGAKPTCCSGWAPACSSSV